MKKNKIFKLLILGLIIYAVYRLMDEQTRPLPVGVGGQPMIKPLEVAPEMVIATNGNGGNGTLTNGNASSETSKVYPSNPVGVQKESPDQVRASNVLRSSGWNTTRFANQDFVGYEPLPNAPFSTIETFESRYGI